MTRKALAEFWGYDPVSDAEIMDALLQRVKTAPTKIKAATAVGVLLVALVVADLAAWRWINDLGQQQVAVSVLVEAALLLIIYFVFEDAMKRRERAAWDRALSFVIPPLVTNAVLTRSAFEAAYRDLDDVARWKQFQASAESFGRHVESASWVATLAPDAAELWTEVNLLALDLAHLASAPRPQDLKAVTGSEPFEQKRDRLRTRTNELVKRTERYQEARHEELVRDWHENPAPPRYRSASKPEDEVSRS